MKILSTLYQTINYDSSNKYLEQVWKETTISMKEADFKTEMLKLATAFSEYMPKKVLIDMRNFNFIVVPEVQRWVNKHVNSVLPEIKTEKVAFIVSPDIFAALSVEQTVIEGLEGKVFTVFFEDKKEAEQWLFKN